MNVLLIHRHFHPDTPPYATMLQSMAQSFVTHGHIVTVLTAQPSYKSTATNVDAYERSSLGFDIKRLGLFFDKKKSIFFKLINMFLFPLRIFLHLQINRNYDVVTISTAPPVLGGFAVALGCWLAKTKFIYHCMDIHPEIGKLSGEFKVPVIYKMLELMDSWTCRKASKVVVLSEDMKRSLLSRVNLNQETVSLEVINNFSLPDDALDTGEYLEYLKKTNVFRVIFAGNVGRFQGLASYIEAVKLMKSTHGFELVFVGEGAALAELKALAVDLPRTAVKFIPHMSVFSAKKLIENADLAIVSLIPEIINYAYPSKTMTYLEQGCPVLVSVELESELAKFVVGSDIGFAVPPKNAQAIHNVFIEAVKHKNKMLTKRKNALNVSTKNFEKNDILQKWSFLIEEVLNN